MELKTCPICKLDKPVDGPEPQFYLRPSRVTADGRPAYQHGCKDCRRAQTERWQAQHPERTRQIAAAASLRYYRRHKAAIKDKVLARRAADPEATRAQWRARYAARKAKQAAV